MRSRHGFHVGLADGRVEREADRRRHYCYALLVFRCAIIVVELVAVAFFRRFTSTFIALPDFLRGISRVILYELLALLLRNTVT